MGRNVWGMLIAGAVLLIAAVAGFVIAGSHGGSYSCGTSFGSYSCSSDGGWPGTTLDALRIASGACGIVGVILVAVGRSERGGRLSQARLSTFVAVGDGQEG